MSNLEVQPEYLKGLAKEQDAASSKAGDAAKAAEHISLEVWLTHGLISTYSNMAATRTEISRREAGEALATAFSDLAAKLRTADDAYRTVDEEMAENLNKQVL